MDSLLNSYILFWTCIIGLCLGSFFNVVILRSLSNENIAFPASKCPKCGNKLKAWHNIPVLSYLFLKGKCAFCKEKISIQYPLIELLTMGLYALSFIRFGISWYTLFTIVIISCLLIMTMTDLKEKLVDCNIAIGLAVIGILYNWLVAGDLLTSIYGLITSVVILEILARLGYLFTNDRAFGEADTYVAGAIGACFGLKATFIILFYTLISSMLVIIPMFLYKQYKNNNKTTCILFILFILSALIFKTQIQNILTASTLILTGLLLSISILKNLKKEACPLYLPLVPAFALGTLYFLFF